MLKACVLVGLFGPLFKNWNIRAIFNCQLFLMCVTFTAN